MENKVKNVLSGIGFYGTLAVCLLVVRVCSLAVSSGCCWCLVFWL